MIANDPPGDVDSEFVALANQFEGRDGEVNSTTGGFATRRGIPRRPLPADLLELKVGIEAANVRSVDGSIEGYVFAENYEVFQFILGGMGMVLEAWNMLLHRKEALKFWLADDANDELLREAQTLAQLRHPNIVTLYGIDEWKGRLYFEMEWIEGQDGRDWLRAKSRSWREIAALFIQAGTGLAAAHDAEKPVQHGDFKPSNILVGNDGRVCVADFGVAGTLRSSERTELGDRIAGTACFMAPERLEGRNGDARSDQYSFCVALWDALHRPPRGAQAPETEPSPVIVPEWLRDVVRKGLNRDPDHRYADMHELLALLTRGLTNTTNKPVIVVESEPAVVNVVSTDVDLDTEVGRARALAQTLSRYPFALAAVGALSGLVLGLGTMMTLQQSSPPRSGFRLGNIDAVEVISAERAQWRLGVRRFNEANEALMRGDVETAQELWSDGRVRVQRFAPLFAGAASLGLAQRIADTNLDLSTNAAAWVTAGAAESFQLGEYWESARQARIKAAEFFRAADLEGAAAGQESCAAAHEIEKPC